MASPNVVALVADARLKLNALVAAAQANGTSKEIVDELLRKDEIIAAQAARIDTLAKQVARLEKVTQTSPTGEADVEDDGVSQIVSGTVGFLLGKVL